LVDVCWLVEWYFDEGVLFGGIFGILCECDVFVDYVCYLCGFVDLCYGCWLKVVVDVGNGMVGYIVLVVLGIVVGLELLFLDVVLLYFELDGIFLNYEVNLFDLVNLCDL